MKSLKSFAKTVTESYRKIFEVPESEIVFESFVKFSNYLFGMLLLDFRPLSEAATSSMRFKYYAKLSFFVFCLLSSATGTLQVLLFGSDDFMVAARLICDVSTLILINFKGFIPFIRRGDIWEITVELEKIYESHEKDKGFYKIKKYLDGYLRCIKMYAAIIVSLMVQEIFIWFSYAFYGKMKLDANFWFPFDAFQPTTFPFALIWSNWNSFIDLIFMAASDSLLYAIITVISMELDILKIDFENLCHESTETRQKKIGPLIDRHNKLFELSDRLQDIYGPTFLLSFVISSLILCLEAFQLSISDTDVMYHFSYTCMIAGQIWLLCWFGQKLTQSSYGVAEEICYFDWTNSDENFRKEVLLIILRAQKPLRLSALNFADISLETFTTVRNSLNYSSVHNNLFLPFFLQILSTTYSYFSLLNSITEN